MGIIKFKIDFIRFVLFGFRSHFQMGYKVEIVEASPKSVLGEGPHWDEMSQSLFYNDIYGTEGSILRYDFAENKVYSAKIDGEPVVSFIIPVANTIDQYAVGIGRRVGIVQWDGKSPKAKMGPIAFDVEQHSKYVHNRFNDAKADPVGRFFGGTMRLEEKGDLFINPCGTFYKYTKGEGVKDLLHNIHCSNGLAWNEKAGKFYYIDSCKLNVLEFDYDQKNGEICEYEIFLSYQSILMENYFFFQPMNVLSSILRLMVSVPTLFQTE